MADIFVDGLGIVSIAGDKPTEIESKAISRKLDEVTELRAEQDAAKASESFDGRKLFRFGLEVAGAIAGTFFSGGLGLPAAAARMSMLSRPFIAKLAKSAAGSGIGSGAGAGVAQIVDPSDDIGREITRAVIEGATAEAIGAPAVIKAGKLLKGAAATTDIGRLSPKRWAGLLDGAEEAEGVLRVQAEKVLKNPENYRSDFYNPERVRKMAEEAKKGLTLGMKTSSRALDTVEEAAQAALIGADDLIFRKDSLAFIGQTMKDDFMNELIKKGAKDETMLGRLLFETLTDGNAMRKKLYQEGIGSIDEIIRKAKGLEAGTKIPATIPTKSIADALKKYSKEQPGNVKDLITLQKDMAKFLRPKVNFTDLKGLRSYFNTKYMDSVGSVMKPGNTILAQGYNRMRMAIDDILNNPEQLSKFDIPQEAVTKLRAVNSQYKEGAKIFGDGSLFAEILKKGNLEKGGSVDAIYSSIIKGKDKPSLVESFQRNLETAVKNGFLTKELAESNIENLRGQFMSNMFDRATKGQQGNFTDFLDASKITGELDKSKRVYEKLFNESERATHKKLFKDLAFSQGTIDKKTGLPGRIFVQLKQAGAIGSLLSFQGVGGQAAVILLAPFGFSKALLNPKLSKLMFEETTKKLADRTPTKSGLAFRNLVGRLADEGLVDSDEALMAIEKSKEIEADLNAKGIKNPTQRNKYTAPAQNIQKAPTQFNFTQLNRPQAPAPTQQTRTFTNPATVTSYGSTYQGLFPMDPTGQAIARQRDQ